MHRTERSGVDPVERADRLAHRLVHRAEPEAPGSVARPVVEARAGEIDLRRIDVRMAPALEIDQAKPRPVGEQQPPVAA